MSYEGDYTFPWWACASDFSIDLHSEEAKSSTIIGQPTFLSGSSREISAAGATLVLHRCNPLYSGSCQYSDEKQSSLRTSFLSRSFLLFPSSLPS